MSLLGRLRAWNKRRKAEAFLYKHGICLIHFVTMSINLFDEWGNPDGSWECPKCKEEAEAKANEKYLAGLEESLREILKDRIDVGADGSRTVSNHEGD